MPNFFGPPINRSKSYVFTDFYVSFFFALFFQDPFKLPTVSEQVINDMKSDGFTFQTPPSSPSNNSSLGSRKSSMCSISSAGSNSTNGSPSHHINSKFRAISERKLCCQDRMCLILHQTNLRPDLCINLCWCETWLGFQFEKQISLTPY